MATSKPCMIHAMRVLFAVKETDLKNILQLYKTAPLNNRMVMNFFIVELRKIYIEDLFYK